MKRQVMKVIQYGEWKVIHDDQKSINPYRVMHNGRKVTDYADFTSCVTHLAAEMGRREHGF